MASEVVIHEHKIVFYLQVQTRIVRVQVISNLEVSIITRQKNMLIFRVEVYVGVNGNLQLIDVQLFIYLKDDETHFKNRVDFITRLLLVDKSIAGGCIQK